MLPAGPEPDKEKIDIDDVPLSMFVVTALLSFLASTRTTWLAVSSKIQLPTHVKSPSAVFLE